MLFPNARIKRDIVRTALNQLNLDHTEEIVIREAEVPELRLYCLSLFLYASMQIRTSFQELVDCK